MKTIRFCKMNGAGNDFVCIDNRSKKYRFTKKQIAKMCHRQQGIGADGFLLLEKSNRPGADFRMRYYNSDGGEAEMCGNGARCFAKFIRHVTGWKKSEVSFVTQAGVIEAKFIKENVRIRMTPPVDLNLNQSVLLRRGSFMVHSVNTGVPHAVVFVRDLGDYPVKEIGRELRFHKKFAPKGTNVNFVQVLAPGKIRIRTYERGVEDETLACGTGTVACALVCHLVKKFSSPVRVKVQGGDTLKVEFGAELAKVFLQGPAVLTFEGEYHV